MGSPKVQVKSFRGLITMEDGAQILVKAEDSERFPLLAHLRHSVGTELEDLFPPSDLCLQWPPREVEFAVTSTEKVEVMHKDEKGPFIDPEAGSATRTAIEQWRRYCAAPDRLSAATALVDLANAMSDLSSWVPEEELDEA